MFLSRSVNRVTQPFQVTAPRIRGWLIFTAAVSAGIIAGLAAADGSGPFNALRPHVISRLAGSQVARTPIDAGTVFPALKPATMTQVITVYDRPPAAARPATSTSHDSGEGDDHNGPPPPTAPPTARPTPRPSPSPSPRPSPSPDPSPGDN